MDSTALFADVIGFRDFIERSKSDQRLVKRWTDSLNTLHQSFLNQPTPTDLCLSTFSDSICVSVPFSAPNFGSFVAGLSCISISLFMMGLPLRGAVVRGLLHHQRSGVVLGPALVQAYELEQAAVYPRILLDSNLPEISDPDARELQLIHEDFDGWQIVNFLGPFPIVCGSLFTEESPEKVADDIRRRLNDAVSIPHPPRIRMKYQWLKKYFDSVNGPTTDYSKPLSVVRKSMEAAKKATP